MKEQPNRMTHRLHVKITAFLLVFAMACTAMASLPAEVLAADGDFTIENGVLTKYNGSGGDVVIPNSVTSIGNSAFYGCSKLTSVTIGNSVTSIGDRAFYGCSKLTSVTIGNSVTSIGDRAFSGCSKLMSVTIPNSVTLIGVSAFYGCSSLTSVTIQDSVTSIENSAFAYCNSLKSITVTSGNTHYSSLDGVLYNKTQTVLLQCPGVKSGSFTIPNSVTSIGDYAFYFCGKLTSVTIGNSVTSIGEMAFSWCDSLTSVTIGNSVTSIGDRAFDNCRSLTSVTIPDSVTSIENSAFCECSSLTSVTIPDSVTSIGEMAFSWCDSLTSITVTSGNTHYSSLDGVLYNKTQTVLLQCPGGKSGSFTIPNSVTSIGDYAFFDCHSLTSISIPNSVTSIGVYAFYRCSSLTSISIPNSVTSIGDYAFYECSSLTSISIPNSVTSIGSGAFHYCSSLTSLSIPNSVTSIGDGAFNGCSSLTSISIPNSVTSIGNYAFYRCSSLTSITIPDSVTSIGDGAFYDCSSLTSISIPNSVTSIGNEAFSYCSRLTSISIPNSVTSIGNSAFDNCSSLTSISIPNSVTSIGNYAFYDCSSLTSISIPNSVTSIGNYPFSFCSSLTSISIPNSVTTIGDHAFLCCSSLTSISIPNSVTSIGNYAFYYCSSLTGISIPNSVTSIGNYAFYYCSSLTGISIPNSVTSIGDYAFYDCSSLTSISIPNSVTSIGSWAFYSCSSLTSISIPNSVTTIGNYAFSGCSSLTSISIPNSVTSIGNYAFSGCSSLTSISIPNSVTSIGIYTFSDCSSLTSISIPNSVTSIGSGAFNGCSSLMDVYYTGSQSQWNKISIGRKNEKLTSATIHYNSLPQPPGTVNPEILELDRSTLTLLVNKSVILNAAINKKVVSNEVLTWISSDESIAKVSAIGKITGVAPGHAIIYAKSSNGYLAKCDVTVENNPDFIVNQNTINFGQTFSDTASGLEVNFLNKKFNLFNMDIGWDLNTAFISAKYENAEKKLLIKIGGGIEKPDDNPSLWRDEYKNIKEFSKEILGKKVDTPQLWNKFSKMRGKLKSKNMKLGFEYDTTVFGYFEFDFSGGELKYSEGGLGVMSTVDASLRWYPIPLVYVKLGLSNELSVRAGVRIEQVSPIKITAPVNFEDEFSIYLSVGADAGISSLRVAYVEGGLKGSLKLSSNATINNANGMEMIKNLNLSCYGSVFLEAGAIGFLHNKWEVKGKTIQLYPKSKTKSSSPKKVASAQDNTATANDFTLVPRAKKTSRKAVAPKNYKTAVGQNLVSNVYPYSEPQMLPLSGDKVLAVWVDDDTSRSEINRTALMYTYFDGSQWSAIQQVNNDGTPDYSPKLIRHGDGAYLVWQNADQAFADGMTLLETASHYNISVAYFDGSSFGEVRNVNDYDNSTLEIQPLLISDGSNLTSVWVEATDNYVYGDQTVFTLCKASADASATGGQKRIVLAENISGLSAIDAAFLNGDEYILYSTEENNEIHVFKNGTETTLSDMSSDFRIVDGKLYWFTDSGVKFAPLDDLDSVTDTAIAFPGNAGNIKFLHNANGGRAMIWKQTEDLKSELFVSYYDTVNHAWVQGIQITNCNAAISDFAATLDSDNKISYIIETREVLDTEDEYPYGEANLLMNSYTKVTDVKADSVYYNATAVVPGETIDFSTSVVNVGTETVSSVTVELLDASGNVLGTTAYSEPILSGESADVAVSTTLPADLASFGVKMRVTAQGDVDTSNNVTDVTQFALPNVVLDSPTVTDTTADGAQIKVNVTNDGFADAENITLNLYQENTDTEPIATQTIEELAKDGSIEVTFSVSRDLLTENEYPYLNQFVVSASVEEDELLYIDNTQVCQVESVRVTGVSFESPSVELKQFTTKQLTATVTPSTVADKGLTWLSTNTDVVTVDENGTITAVSGGQAKIMVVTSDGGLTAECEITVQPLALEISDSEATLIIGDTKKLTVTLDNKDFTEGTWSSSDDTVVTVSEDGTVTAVAAGTATVQFTAYNETLREISCEVTVEAPPITFTASPDSPQKIGTPVTLTATGGSSYRFYYEQNGKWVNIRDFAEENTCEWTPTVPREYTIYVDVKDDSGNLITSKRIEYTVTDLYSFTLDKANEQNVGVNMTLTAEGGASYKFYYEYNGAWCSITSNTTGVCEWSPKYAGNYMLYVDIKDETGKVIACRTQAFKLNDPFSLTCDKESSELPYGTTINFTADGGTSYKFYYEKQGEWVRVQNFSESNTCAWTPKAAGTYNFYCDIKDASGKVVSCKRMTFHITNPYSFTADKTGNQPVGTAITFTATGGHQYKFYYEKDGTWARIQSFSTTDTCIWAPTEAGRYNVYCDIADENGKVLAYKGMEFVIGDVDTGEFTFTTSLDSPQPMNTEVTLTATGGASYKFYYEVGGKWATIQSFSTADTATWKPDMITDYTLYVDIKNSSGKVVKTLSKKFTSTDPYSFTVNATSPQDIGQSVTFTAAGGTSYKFYYQYAGAWVKIQDSTSATCNWRPNKAGEYMVYVDIKDASGTVLTCRTMKLIFNDPYTFTTTAGSLTQPVGTAISLEANGGTSYKFYYEKDGAWIRIRNFSAANTCTWKPTEAGTYNVYCDMKDASGSVAVCKRITFTVTD